MPHVIDIATGKLHKSKTSAAKAAGIPLSVFSEILKLSRSKSAMPRWLPLTNPNQGAALVLRNLVRVNRKRTTKQQAVAGLLNLARAGTRTSRRATRGKTSKYSNYTTRY